MDLELTIDIVAIFALVVSVISLVLSWRTSSRYSQMVVFNEYTRRFQEIVVKLYTNPKDPAYHKLYFDLCCLEYILLENNLLPPKIWDSWVCEMKQIIKNNSYIQDSWDTQQSAYDNQKDFKKFFEEIVAQSKTIK